MKAWKAIFLAPVFVGMMTGCGGDNKKHNDGDSKFVGVWGSDLGISDLRTLGKQRNDYMAFCRRVKKHPDWYGVTLTNDSRSHVRIDTDSFIVHGDGSVDTLETDKPDTRFGGFNAYNDYNGNVTVSSHHWGRVNNDGSYSQDQYRASQFKGDAFFAMPDALSLQLKRGDFSQSDVDLNYIRSSQQEITEYANAINSCYLYDNGWNDKTTPPQGGDQITIVPNDPNTPPK